jgi:hypothetical protein
MNILKAIDDFEEDLVSEFEQYSDFSVSKEIDSTLKDYHEDTLSDIKFIIRNGDDDGVVVYVADSGNGDVVLAIEQDDYVSDYIDNVKDIWRHLYFNER